LTQSEETGVILVEDDLCNGCGWCFEACDFGAITLDPEKKVVRIDSIQRLIKAAAEAAGET
jgi:Fe-S-cluster-containing dehydrogenase component